MGETLKSSLAGVLLTSAAVFVVSVGCIVFAGEANSVGTFWPSNAILLAALLRQKPGLKTFVLSLLGGGTALMLAELASGDSLIVIAVLTLANLVEVTVAAWLLRAFHPAIPNLTDIKGLVSFLVIASVLAPAVSATIAATTVSTANATGWRSIWMPWYTADALGMAIVGPFALMLNAEHWRTLRNSKNYIEIFGISAAVLLVAAAASYHRLLFLLIVPVTVISASRLGILGTAVATLSVALIGSLFIVTGIGTPIITSLDVSQRVVAFQIFLAANVFWAFPVAAVLGEKKRLVAQVSSDNSQLKTVSTRQSQMLIDLRRKLANAEERERLRLARELHDQTGQMLAGSMLELKAIEPLVSMDGRGRVARLHGMLEEISKTLHRIAWQLRPTSIEDCGLARALENYVGEWNKRFGIKVDFHCADAYVDPLPDEVRIAIYRIVQESLTNISKHASGATIVSIVIERIEGVLHLTVEDDGCGFDPEMYFDDYKISTEGGLGLFGMRERVTMLGGEIKIQSSIGTGTTIFVRIPLAEVSS